ncbi:delta-1-pyrroline-5-carboxylate synthase-like protein, partial [Tanacetum coccineum]
MLFHREAHTFIPNVELNAHEMAVAVRESSRLLQVGSEARKASLAIRTENDLLLKGGKEAKRSNAILHKIITSCITETVGKGLICLMTSRDEIPKLLK